MDYFVKLRAKDNHGDVFVSYRIITANAFNKMIKDFSNATYPYKWYIGKERFIEWEYPHAFEKCFYLQQIDNNIVRILLEIFNFNEFEWPVNDD